MSPASDVLMRLGASTAEAVAKALDAVCAEPVGRGDVAVVSGGDDPFAGFGAPALAVSVAYVDGVTGGNVLLLTLRGARLLAAAIGGAEAPVDADAEAAAELSELELSAVEEVANQTFAAAAHATSVVLGEEVAIAPPETRPLDTLDGVRETFDATPHAVVATLDVRGEPCRLVQLVPTAFVVRMTRALDERGGELTGDGGLASLGPAGDGGVDERSLTDALRDIRVRVWAELGRTRVALGDAPQLPTGAVLELDRKADDPVDLYVNGLRFASGGLVLTEDGEWALRLDEVAGRTADTREEVEI